MFANINGEEIPEYYGKPYIEICNNVPDFSEFPQQEKYKKIGNYKRCGEEYIIYYAYDCIKWIYTSEEKNRPNKKKEISKYYPDKYPFIKGDGYLFNYCHLIAHQLLGEDSDKRNLVVGTRYMNEMGMLPFEYQIKKCLENKNQVSRVLYRVTPIYSDGDQLIKGVQMEAFSVEDNGKEICFNIFAYNVQPRVTICYKCGSSKEDKEWCEKIFSQNKYTEKEKGTQDYILNISTHKFHNPSCNCIKTNQIKKENRKIFKWPRKFLEDNGYKPCGNCKP